MNSRQYDKRKPPVAIVGALLLLSLWLPAGAQANKSAIGHMLEVTPDQLMSAGLQIDLLETHKSGQLAFIVSPTTDVSSIQTALNAQQVEPQAIIEILDQNSPVRGGGVAAGENPRTGHKTFLIKRDIPGVGHFPDEKKAVIAGKSNAAIAEIGDDIEWVHSWLTDKGTYCIYRAIDEATIREHGAIIGAKIIDVYQVE